MDCGEARTLLLSRRRGALEGAALAEIRAHLEGCEACRREDAADEALSTVLETRLPQALAPEALRRSLAARWSPRRRSFSPMLAATMGLAAGVAASLLVGLPRLGLSVPAHPERAGEAMVTEAVNDHLRVLYDEHPLEVESGGIHQVKPWFTGRLDFAPVVPFAGDDDFPLQGGSVAYFLDRKAAAFVFKRRLHTMTVLVFRAEGLPWPSGATDGVGDARGKIVTSRGFHVLLWKKGDLGYAVVSDVDGRDVEALGAKVAGGG